MCVFQRFFIGSVYCWLAIVVTGGCQPKSSTVVNSTPAPTPNLAEMKRIEKLDPKAEFKKAIAKKYLRFIAVRGVGTEVPGVPQSIANPFVQKYGFDVVDGTSDFIETTEQGRLDDVVRRYALSYNKMLLDHLSKQQK